MKRLFLALLIFGLSLACQSASLQTEILSYNPSMMGATDNPTVTYTAQNGWYMVNSKMLTFGFQVKTSSITKTTLSDKVRISLPRTRSAGGADIIVLCRGENSSLAQNANQGSISPGANYVEFYQQPLTTARSAITYLLTSLGLLSGNITFECSGSYNID